MESTIASIASWAAARSADGPTGSTRTRRSACTRRAAASQALETRRRVAWNLLFSRALRLELLSAPLEPLLASRSWWFDDFRVELEHDRFTLHGCGSWISHATLRLDDVPALEASLQAGYALLSAYQAEVAAERHGTVRATS